MEPQTVDLYTADLYVVILSDYNDNFSKYNQDQSYRLQLQSDYSHIDNIFSDNQVALPVMEANMQS